MQTFEEAFDEMFTRAFRLSYRILGDHASAEDVAAEACARAYAAWNRVEGLSHRDAWVLRVASNLAIDITRRKLRHAEPVIDDRMDDQVAVRLALGAALRALPRRQRETVVLRHLAGLSEIETARALDISPGSVKTHVSRGLASLRTHLGEGFQEVSLV